MKKQIAFYIGWDIVFFLLMYFNFWLNATALEALTKSPTLCYQWLFVVLFIIIGMWMSFLMLIGRKFTLTKKLAIAEFIIVGLLAFYLATYAILPLSIVRMVNWETFSYPYIFFEILNSNLPIIAGGILLGYEIFTLIIRLVNFKRTKTEIGSSNSLNEM